MKSPATSRTIAALTGIAVALLPVDGAAEDGISSTTMVGPAVVEVTGILPAPAADVWRAFTTAEGLSGFWAPAAMIEPRVGGLFEIYLCPDCPPGQRGLEGNHILAFEPGRRMMMTWGVPFMTTAVHGRQHTVAEVSLRPVGGRQTLLRLRILGLGEGPGWLGAELYFHTRWRSVYRNLLLYLQTGEAIDWVAAGQRFAADSQFLVTAIGAMTPPATPGDSSENNQTEGAKQ